MSVSAIESSQVGFRSRLPACNNLEHIVDTLEPLRSIMTNLPTVVLFNSRLKAMMDGWLKVKAMAIFVPLLPSFLWHLKTQPNSLREPKTRSSATAEKQRVSCPHGGRVGLDRPAPSPSVRSGYTYAYG